MSSRAGKRAVNQTPSEQMINVTSICNTGPLNCGAAPNPPCEAQKSICDQVFKNNAAGGGGGGGCGGGVGGKRGSAMNNGGRGKASGGGGQRGSGCGGGGGGGSCGVGGGRGGGQRDSKGSGAPEGMTMEEVAGLIHSSMLTLWQDQKLCDVLLHANGEDVRAHKMALAAYSEFLVEKFCRFSPGEVVTIDLCEFSSTIVYAVVNYVYTGSVELCIEVAGPILKCADELGICALVCLCLEYLGNITCETAVMIYSIAENYCIEELRDRAVCYICENFSSVAMTKHFMYLPFERLITILCDDNLNIPCEIDVFCAIVAWIDFDRCERICCAPKLLQCGVRLHCISPELLITKVETVEWLFEVPDCEYILNEAIRFHALNLSGSRLAPEFGETHKPRLPNPSSCFGH